MFTHFLVKFNGRVVLLADGIKNPKEGRKMPGVKNLHQESTNNSKPKYVMAHSCQAICLLVKGVLTFFAIPLACAIHEGTITSNRDTKTLHDKLMILLEDLQFSVSYYFVADAFYATRKIINPLKEKGQHLLTKKTTSKVAPKREIGWLRLLKFSREKPFPSKICLEASSGRAEYRVSNLFSSYIQQG